MKNAMVAALLLVSGTMLRAQTGTEGEFEFDKKIRATAHGYRMELTGPVAYLEPALAQVFGEYTQTKPKTIKKDLLVYESVSVPVITPSTLNYYYRLETQTKNGARPALTIFLSPGNDNFWGSDKYPAEFQTLKAFMQRIDAQAFRLQTEAEISAQTAALGQLTAEIADMDKKHADRQAEITRLQQELEALKAAHLQYETQLTEQRKRQAELQQKLEALKAKL
ncbi:MAG: hypothetical protein SF053_09705 [Bacteroidia bacterium]|nr:hypothetical protein [Bacteroidia bacterium]